MQIRTSLLQQFHSLHVRLIAAPIFSNQWLLIINRLILFMALSINTNAAFEEKKARDICISIEVSFVPRCNIDNRLSIIRSMEADLF
jgi:hypothetical protein